MQKYLIVDVVSKENQGVAVYCAGRPMASHIVEGVYHLIYCEELAKNQKDIANESVILKEFPKVDDHRDEWMNYCAGLTHGDDFLLTEGAHKFIEGMWKSCLCGDDTQDEFSEICTDLKAIKENDQKA